MSGGVGEHQSRLAEASHPRYLTSFPGLIVTSVANLCFKSVYGGAVARMQDR